MKAYIAFDTDNDPCFIDADEGIVRCEVEENGGYIEEKPTQGAEFAIKQVNILTDAELEAIERKAFYAGRKSDSTNLALMKAMQDHCVFFEYGTFEDYKRK